MRIAVFGDIHFPFHHEKALKEALYVAKQFKPTHVVQIGDLYDQYSFSRFTKKNIISSDAELSEARARAINMWGELSRSLRSANLTQILGNHDVRLIKRSQEKLPEAQDLIKEKVMELYQFKGVKTVQDDREHAEIGGIIFHHGFKSKLGDHMKHFGRNTVVGHSHVGGVVFEKLNGKVRWELNAGFLADETSEPLRYRPSTTSKWTLGIGLIDEKGPRFCPL